MLRTLDPITWYVKISANPSEANISSAVKPNSLSATPKASSVGANTVKSPGPPRTGSKPAASIAAVNVV